MDRTTLNRRAFWLAQSAARSATGAALARRRSSQWTTTDDSVRVSLERLLLHASSASPVYRSRLAEAGVVIDGVVHVNRFDQVPLLTKDDLRYEGLAVAADLLRRGLRRNTSGGSTGEPVTLWQDARYRGEARATKLLFDEWAGTPLGCSQLLLWGSERDVLNGSRGLRARMSSELRRQSFLNTFRIEPDGLERMADTVDAKRPDQILAYVDSAHALARHLLTTRRAVFPPTAIMTTAGTLTPPVRSDIERAFRAPVFNRYGSREVGDIACECDRHAGLHVCSDTHLVEVLDSKGRPVEEGEHGEVVVTLLTNFAHPLIRYRIGDTATKGSACPCGRRWPVLYQVTGRLTDHFVRQDSGLVHGEFITHLFYERTWLRQFRAVQRSLTAIDVDLVVNGPVPKEELDEIRRSLNAAMGEQVTITFTTVDDIAPTPSGKYRYTVSEVPML